MEEEKQDNLNKQHQEQEKQSKMLSNELKNKVENKLQEFLQVGIKEDNVDYLYKLIDIHKDIENEEYWKFKKEGIKMRYNTNYGRDDYDREEYGNYRRRGRDSRGRYMARGNYRGEEMIDDMREMYGDYSESREEYDRGNYGAKEDTMKSLDYMLKSVVQFMQMLESDASSEEEMQLIKKYARKISEM